MVLPTPVDSPLGTYVALMVEGCGSRSSLLRLRRRIIAGDALYRRPCTSRPEDRHGRPSTIRPGYAVHSPQLRELGARLRALRLARHLLQSHVSAAAGVTSEYIADIEAGRVRPSPEVLRRLAAALGGDADELTRLAGYG